MIKTYQQLIGSPAYWLVDMTAQNITKRATVYLWCKRSHRKSSSFKVRLPTRDTDKPCNASTISIQISVLAFAYEYVYSSVSLVLSHSCFYYYVSVCVTKLLLQNTFNSKPGFLFYLLCKRFRIQQYFLFVEKLILSFYLLFQIQNHMRVFFLSFCCLSFRFLNFSFFLLKL